MTSGRRFGPEIFRHFFLADIISLKTMARAVLRFRQPLVFRVRLRTVAKTLSIGFVVRMCFQCSAGKS
ncbi:hypothetical protein RAZWK3B_14813 [Roseobacter sp. AzwK-3b]|nr:hypothetical protein RAZWK3B_14813 [Roseobacter sp. AzwK-3b]